MANIDDNVKSLITILENSNVDELEVSTFWGRQKIKVRKNTAPQTQSYEILPNDEPQHSSPEPSAQQTVVESPAIPPVAPTSQVDVEPPPPPQAEDTVGSEGDSQTIKAPLVGTFYASVKPGDPPFISEGDMIKEGQVICIIEAMKIFNEIESEVSGKVEKILIKDSTPVEYDQDLIIISPA